MKISLSALSEKTVTKYEQLEREGKLSKRQKRALWGHRNISQFTELIVKQSAKNWS